MTKCVCVEGIIFSNDIVVYSATMANEKKAKGVLTGTK